MGCDITVTAEDKTTGGAGQKSTTETHKEVTKDAQGNTITTTTTTTTNQKIIEERNAKYDAVEHFEAEFPEDAFASGSLFHAPIEMIEGHEGELKKVDITSMELGAHGEIKIDAIEGANSVKIRGQFTAEGKVRMVKHTKDDKVKYKGDLIGNHIEGSWFSHTDGGLFKITFNGKVWEGVDTALTYADGATIASISQVKGKWGVIDGTKTASNLNLTIHFADGTEAALTGVETLAEGAATLELTCKLPGVDEETLYLTQAAA